MSDFPADRYPWSEPSRAGVLTSVGWAPEAHDFEASDLRDRTPVIAVGSNASAPVLTRKLGDLLATGLPVATCAVQGLGVGHLAHVSIRGFIAAAPFRRPATSDGEPGLTRTVVAWFDPAQLAALDATEPNYRRVPLPPDMVPAPDGERHLLGHISLTGVQVYESVHGVLGQDGTPLTLGSQADVLGWLADRLPSRLHPLLDHEALLEAENRRLVTRAFTEAGLVVRQPLSGR